MLNAMSSDINKDQVAEISFYDQTSKLHTAHMQYYIDTNKVQYGVKFGVMLYKIAVSDCKVVIPNDIEEYFAAYISLDESCNSQNIISDLENHGADFIFINSKKISQSNGKLMSNTYPIPVFFIENNEDVFQLEAGKDIKQYINIFFLLVF
jgi:hypothetical protein